MTTHSDTINALLSAASEIRSLRRQIVEVKAEAWDVHSEIIKRLFGGGGMVSICPAHQAERIANELALPKTPDSNIEP